MNVDSIAYYSISYNDNFDKREEVGSMAERKRKWTTKDFDRMNDYNRKHYDRLNLVVGSGKRELIKAAAAARGQSINDYIITLLEKDLDTDLRPERAGGEDLPEE